MFCAVLTVEDTWGSNVYIQYLLTLGIDKTSLPYVPLQTDAGVFV